MPAFGGVIPPVGTRVRFDIVQDEKTGRPRAERVEASDVPAPQAVPSACPEPQVSLTPQSDAVIAAATAAVAALTSSTAPNPILAMPAPHGGYSCNPSLLYQPQATAMSLVPAGMLSGTMLQDHGRFGFISQDNGEADMFVMPQGCLAFGNVLPPLGTRVLYEIINDAKTGRPRAENVQPEPGLVAALAQAQPSYGAVSRIKGGALGAARSNPYVVPPLVQPLQAAPVVQVPQQQLVPSLPQVSVPIPAQSSALLTGTMEKDNGNFGFIRQDADSADMFAGYYPTQN